MKRFYYYLAILLGISLNIKLEAQTVRAADSLALVALYNSTNGANWTKKWDLNQPVNTWHGVTVKSSRVGQLRLKKNNLVGTVPAAIADLTALTVLALNENNLAGNIQPAIGSLTELDVLDLQSCQLQGSIPLSFANLTKLRGIAFSRNQINRFPQTVVNGMKKLNLVWASHNHLDSLPDFSPTSIAELLVEHNRLHFDDIIRNNNIKGLILHRAGYAPQAQVRAGKTYETKGVASLTLTVNVRGAGNTYQWFWGDTRIEGATAATLTISDPATKPGYYYCQIKNPQVFELTLASGADLLKGLGGTNAQDSLALVAVYNSTNGANWKNKWDLAKPVNSWHGVSVRAGRVTKLNLADNGIKGSIPAAIGNLTELVYLSVSFSDLQGSSVPTSIGNLTKLEELFLIRAKVGGPIPTQIGNLAKLRVLSFADNTLTGSLPTEIGNLTELVELNFSHNRLTGSIPATIGNLTKAGAVLLDNNQLSGAIPPEMGNLIALTRLHLQKNKLTGAVPDTFKKLDALAVLELQFNRLTSFPDISRTKIGAKYINIQANHMSFKGMVPVLNSMNPNGIKFSDGREVEAFKNIFHSPQLSREGRYHVVSSGTKQLILQSGIEPLTQTIRKGSVINIVKTVYQWFKGTKQRIAGAAEKDLVLTDLKPEDEGVYYCVSAVLYSTLAVTLHDGTTLDKTAYKGDSVHLQIESIDTVQIAGKPTDIALDNNTSAENTPLNTKIGTLTTTDPNSGDKHTYKLGGTDAASFKIVNDELQNAVVFNFESKTSYSITITSTDRGGLTFTKNFTVNITNVNEAPTAIQLSGTSIAENSLASTLIGNLTTTDPDAGDNHTYTLGGADAASFKIMNARLENAAAFDFETKSSYSITITTTDAGGLRFSQNFTITVTDVAEVPTPAALPEVDNAKTEAAFSVYPNPSSGLIKIGGLKAVQNVELKVIAENGQTVRTYSKVQASYDLSGLPDGLYVILIQADGKTQSVQFILN